MLSLDERHSLWYARQKIWEAVGCLIGRKSFRDRLIAAAHPLAQLKHLHASEVARLPESVRGRFDDIVQALTKHPPNREEGLDNRIEASVHKLTPRQRAEIAQDILEIFVILCGGL
jgi:hypothetical protein